MSPAPSRTCTPRAKKAPLDARTLAALEFPAVIDRLAALTSWSAGREAARALRPASDLPAVVRAQRETAEAVTLERLGAGVPMGGARDVRERARGAARGQVLTPSELMEVAGLARAAGLARRALARVLEQAPLLANIASGIPDLGALRVLIEDAIDDQGAVRDGASPELASIRHALNAAHERLVQRMQALAASSALRNALQDAIVVMRDGRYVLPVKADFRGAVRGVVHDTSASGATLYIEPLAVVELGNAWREHELEERREVERILRALSAAVGEAEADLEDAVLRLGHLDMTQAKGRLAAALDARDLAASGPRQPWLVAAPAELRLVEARHPLLGGALGGSLGGPPGGTVVPTSIRVGGDFDALLITGPNTGGKTVALKTAGLLCLMALAGLPVPAAAGSQVPVYDAVFADIGDEQSIEQSLSTFSGHITAIIDIIQRAGPRSLVLLDELGAGTDPTEGAALGIAIVDRVIAQGASLIATTHHSELKVYAYHTPRVTNASVEFDMGTLRPTYRLSIGLPGQSNALAIAGNLGMPPDVIAAARAGLSRDEQDLESLLGDLRVQLATAEARGEQAATAAAEAEALRAEWRARVAALDAESAAIREEARARVRRELRDVDRYLERSRRKIEAARLEQARADYARAAREAEHLDLPPIVPARAGIEAVEGFASPELPPVGPIDVYLGGTIWLRGISTPGEALTEPDADGAFEVQLGALRARARLDQVERTGDPRPPARMRETTISISTPLDVGPSIEVRGQRLADALPRIEEFLDRAARGGRPRVLLIHGKGTGTMRRAVRELLDRHPLVTRYETAERAEGGDGVTVAYIETL
ncbi:MAG: endonuclease MutS2 [Dehalococcoidia bacterium]|nr:endonuclease MutS2 [Dehalococcoidia bacterium]